LLLAAGFVVLFVAVGPELLALFLGEKFQLARTQLGLMAAGSGLIFACVIEQAALVAMSAWHRVALAWGVAVITFFGVLALPIDETWAVSVAVIAAPAVSFLLMAASRALLLGPVFDRPLA
jgi:hypothetical protein